MSILRDILPVVDPTIKVDPIYMEDSETGPFNPAIPDGHTERKSARAGAWTPVIAVRSILFSEDEIRGMNLSLSSKVPRLSVTVKDSLRKFDVNFPLDGDVVSVYLRPPDVQNQRPIRLDFDIVGVSSSPVTRLYSFSCVLKVPGMFGEYCRSFGRGTSYEHLRGLSADLGLGFASNVDSTGDPMVRICPYETYETFVQQTVSTCYKDDDSFFTWFIDPYYYLSLVEVNRLFSEEESTDPINISAAVPFSGIIGQDADTPDTVKGSLVLTNKPELRGMNTYIEAYSLENGSADVWIGNGYRKVAQYYESGTAEYLKSTVDPLTTPGAERTKILLKGRPDEDLYRRVMKHKWLGRQWPESLGGNVHDSYLYAAVLNQQNLSEIGKMSLKVHLSGMNFYVTKWSRVPVLIYSPTTNFKNTELLKKRDSDLGESGDPSGVTAQGINALTGEAGSDGLEPGDWVKNEFLSGYYVVSAVDYRYSPPGPVKQVLTLVRREWPIPAKNKDS